MPLSEHELLKLEIDAEWDVFCDADPNLTTARLAEIDPAGVQLLKFAFARGFTAGARSAIRSFENERS